MNKAFPDMWRKMDLILDNQSRETKYMVRLYQGGGQKELQSPLIDNKVFVLKAKEGRSTDKVNVRK